jgi:hypothetical protein
MKVAYLVSNKSGEWAAYRVRQLFDVSAFGKRLEEIQILGNVTFLMENAYAIYFLDNKTGWKVK